MKKTVLATILFLLIILVFITSGFAENPIVQTIFTADPAPMVYNDTCYVYTGHDSTGATEYIMKEWNCFSSTDMANWTDHGVIFKTADVSWHSGETDANSGQCVYRNNKFYWYFSTACSSDDNKQSIGVAISNSPTGSFVDALGQPLVYGSQMTAATHESQGLDPTVFIDDDGQAYLYWGNKVCYWVKLNDDMISFGGSINYILPSDTAALGPDYKEAPWIYKNDNMYYLVYASSLPEYISYSTSPSPAGPWTYRGVVMPTQGTSSTNHPGICEYKGNSYFVYHNDALPGGGSYQRSVCIEQFNYNTDGTLPKLTMTTSGPAQIGNLNPYDKIEAETILPGKWC